MGGAIRVLLIEDSEDDAILILDELRRNGYEPESRRVQTAEEMRSMLRDEPWDVIIADYTLPRFSGPEALRTLQETDLDIPFILVSGTMEDHVGVDMMRLGAQDFVLKHNLSRLGPAVTRELKEAASRRERRRAERRERELEEHQHEFFRRTLLAITEGKLHVSDREEIEQVAKGRLASWTIRSLEEMGQARDSIMRLAEEAGMDPARAPGLALAVMEAMANAFKHAGEGEVTLSRTENGLMVTVSDHGPGIETLALPDVALTKGYTTGISLGMGYKVILQMADRVYLATGPEGTTVGIEMGLRE